MRQSCQLCSWFDATGLLALRGRNARWSYPNCLFDHDFGGVLIATESGAVTIVLILISSVTLLPFRSCFGLGAGDARTTKIEEAEDLAHRSAR